MKQVYDVRAKVVETKYVDKKAKARERALQIVDLIIFWICDAWMTYGILIGLEWLEDVMYNNTAILNPVYDTVRFTVFLVGLSVMLSFYLTRYGLKKLHKVIMNYLSR